ncbi:hypothetical protein [Streptomyces lavendofoliae]|uniref:hypothetical protein n=1 Tax=Streptomyces lavendofoliae TaxID=67314 RepID=UPI003D8F3905
MFHHPCTGARRAPYTALLLTLSVLLTTLLPVGTAWAADTPAPASAADGTAAEDCAVLPLSPLGDPGSAVTRAAVPADGAACFTFTTDQPGMHRVLLDGAGPDTHTQVYDGDSPVECYDHTWGAGWCPLPRVGTHTLKVVNGWPEPDEVGVAVVPLMATGPCAPETGTSYDLPPVTGSAPGPTAIICHPFSAKANERITLDARTTRYGSTDAWITDETGTRICPHLNEDGSEGCVLPGDGPYRVLIRVREAEGGYPADYTLKVRRLSDPAGCADVPLNTYNSAPTTVERATGCRTFTAPAAGRYDVFQVTPSGDRSKATVHDRAGKTVCESWKSCEVPAAGTYTVLTEAATLILDPASTAGCEPAAVGTYQSAFTAAGEIDCLRLALPEGARMAAMTALNGPSPRPDVTVVDADGIQRCEHSTLSTGTCSLIGKAPFRALVSTEDTDPATGSYRIALHRTDAATDGCQVVPAGDFTATSAAARFRTGDGTFSHCLSIPADSHSAMEAIQLQAVSGTSTAQFSVLDRDGRQVCDVWPSLSAWSACALAPGVAHTVLVTGRDVPAEYTLTRRDLTASAKGCTANPATAVGGPSTGGTPGAPGTLLCRQVTTADAQDTLHLNVRDPLGTANFLAFGADGGVACGNRNRACAVTGSTRYQVLITVPTNLKPTPSYHFDALRIATAAGPAAECRKVPNISYGYGPVAGTLDEQHTALCASLPTAYRDRFDFKASDTAGGTETVVPALYNSQLVNGCSLATSSGYQCGVNADYSSAVTPTLLVIGLPEKVSRAAYSAELACSSGLCGTEKPSVTSVTPAGGAGGSKVTVTVTGTALHKGDKVRIGLGSTRVEATTLGVSEDRRTLTASLDLTGAQPGSWYLSLITHNGYEYPAGGFSVTTPAPKNTAVPSMSGPVQVGGRVTAAPGGWTPAPSAYSYQWKADGQPVIGATAATYTVPPALLNKKLSVTVTARTTGGAEATAASVAVTVAKGIAPKATTAPTISGAVRVGARLTAVSGVWAPAASSYAYQWKADGRAISGATAAMYTVPATYMGKKLSVTVTAHRTGHSSGAATSVQVAVAKGVAPKATKPPLITGTAKVGRTLTAAPGTWSPSPSAFGYQWYAGGRALAGATRPTLVIASAQRGLRITVKVTAHRTGHLSGSAVSAPTVAVVR